jgi:predicted aspartyl protease
MKILLVRAAFIVTAVAFPVCSAQSETAARNLTTFLATKGFTEVKMKRRFLNHLFVPVKINEKPGALLVATAAETTGIDRSSAARLGLIEQKSTRHIHGSLGPSNEPLGMTNLELAIGATGPSNVRVAILNLTDLNKFKNQSHLDGVLGLSEMQRFGTVLDCAGEKLYARAGGDSRSASAELAGFLASTGFVRVPMRLDNKNHRFAVNASINGRRTEMVVDTGAFITCVTKQTATTTGISILPKSVLGAAAGGRREGLRIGRAKEIKVGDFRIETPDVGIGNLWADSLGIEYLSLNNGIIDVGGMALYLRRPARAPVKKR